MAHLRCDFYSDVLGLSTSMTVILPQQTTTQIGLSGTARDGGHPTLYLLHGLSDDDTTWTRRTSIERYVSTMGLAVVMPQVHRSFYADEAHGNRYWTFLSEELPAVAESFFRLSPRREDTFVAGLSMGGYGAVKWALRCPERFAAAASLSGSLDIRDPQRWRDKPSIMKRVFGESEDAVPTQEDVLALARRIDPNIAPSLYIACGQQDRLCESNELFVKTAESAGLAVTSKFTPGEHTWDLWDARIRDVLDWLPLH
ncbi:S-formylglutathione hydrolase FrmB [Nakamurella panacisegetis]|uniref:S-formylglutathione hydrolase FrmB n=1 Tax=Nakamurella panacisegetis TaxID=1090615 RepID=A0A1H0MT31_9ACTN|nr:alpha/beta hydrolase family protein [Nakamurella panacisegetis]SDO83514.1 S-formylglutathione hydrolase FrmB [Nakamurella panacisegetis]